MSREIKAVSLSIIGALVLAGLGFGAASMLVWSCGDSTGEQVECTSPGDCPVQDVCKVAVCEEGHCGVKNAVDGRACRTDIDGLCLDGVCRNDVCYLGESELYVVGTVSSGDGCSICDPYRSRQSWSPVQCTEGINSACLNDPTCVSDGTCKGQECCQQTPAWDGTGTPPDCEFPGGGNGICNENGDCVGCNSDADCDAGLVCHEGRCNESSICEQVTSPNGTDCQIGGADGKCQGGTCFKICIQDEDCQVGQYCDDDGLCRDKLNNGRPCVDGEQCSSGFCEPAAEEDAADRRCTAADCTVCEYASLLGTCDPLTDGATPADCTGACSDAYTANGSWMCCDGTCACVPSGESCP
ncbi:MAG: hypothetical protein JXR96_02585 [Deltaproteobacteria bacterium]|nr:hypothetical protein [Deltaproteobacteria bacterium]